MPDREVCAREERLLCLNRHNVSVYRTSSPRMFLWSARSVSLLSVARPRVVVARLLFAVV